MKEPFKAQTGDRYASAVGLFSEDIGLFSGCLRSLLTLAHIHTLAMKEPFFKSQNGDRYAIASGTVGLFS